MIVGIRNIRAFSILSLLFARPGKISMDSILEASTHISDDVRTQIRDDGSRALWNSFVDTFLFGLILV